MDRSRIVGIAWGLGYRLALPIVLLALGGRFADKTLDSAPIFLLAGIFLAMAVSLLLIWQLVKTLAAS